MESGTARPRIVLADDNFTTQQVLRLSFAGEDVEIECCDSGEAALRQIEHSPVQVLLANIFLPDMDGYELCRRLRERGHREIGVVMLVGAFQSFDEERARRVGCHHSLSKPFDTFALVSLVRRLIESPPEQEPQVEDGFLFKPVLPDVGTDMVFELSLKQCASSPSRLEREIILKDLPRVEFADVPVQTPPHSTMSSGDRERLLEELSARVPEAIRKILPDIVRELEEPH